MKNEAPVNLWLETQIFENQESLELTIPSPKKKERKKKRTNKTVMNKLNSWHIYFIVHPSDHNLRENYYQRTGASLPLACPIDNKKRVTNEENFWNIIWLHFFFLFNLSYDSSYHRLSFSFKILAHNSCLGFFQTIGLILTSFHCLRAMIL